VSNRFDFGGVHLSTGEDTPIAHPSAENPFCVALVGDFSGRGNRGIVEPRTIGERSPFLVDRDNFDEVLASVSPRLRLSVQDAPYEFHFSSLDDFHPDRLFEHEFFSRLRGLRIRLQDPSALQELANELGFTSSKPTRQESGEAILPAPSPVDLASGSLLDQTIETTESRVSAGASPEVVDPLRKFAQQLAAKYAERRSDPQQPELIATVDRLLGDAMRAVLHHPDFQALEAAWQAAAWLIREVDSESRIRFYLLDISKEELAADFASAASFEDTGFFRLTVKKAIRTYGADPWAVMVGDYRFGPEPGDLHLLAGLAKTAHSAQAPFIAEAGPAFLGLSSFSQVVHGYRPVEPSDWTALRSLPEANSIALGMPRFLLRLPYGRNTAPTEAFDFEEFAGSPSHDGYLWGNPGFAITLLLCQTFAQAGWEMHPGQESQINGLPLHIFGEGSSSQAKPCAEVLFTDDAVEQILETGLIPLVSYKSRDSIRVMRFQSVSQVPRPLAGRWLPSLGTQS